MKKFEPPLWVEVKQSNYLFTFIISIHSVALLSSLFLAVQVLLKTLLLILVCYSMYFHLQRYLQRYYPFCLKHTSEFGWELDNKGHITRIRILNSSVLTSFLIVLQVQNDQKKQSLLICRDAVSTEAYRQLLVTLKITATDSVGK